MIHEHDNPVCYHQSCPVCGRNLRIRVMLLGQRVYCQHCGGGFIATDVCDNTTAPRVTAGRPQSSIVAELIERAGGRVVELDFLIELAFLKGREKLSRYPIFAPIRF